MKVEISDYVKELIQRTRQGSHVIDGKISQDRVVGYFETILVGLTELEAKAAKWDMIQWAIDLEVEFVECEHYKPECSYLLAYDKIKERDIELLKYIYKERETNG